MINATVKQARVLASANQARVGAQIQAAIKPMSLADALAIIQAADIPDVIQVAIAIVQAGGDLPEVIQAAVDIVLAQSELPEVVAAAIQIVLGASASANVQDAARQILYDAGRLPGVHNLPAELTIEGHTELPAWRYNGRHAVVGSLPAWGYGPDLISDTGDANIELGKASPFQGPQDGAFGLTGQSSGRYWSSNTEGPHNEVGNFGLDNVWIEFLIRYRGPDLPNRGFLGKRFQLSGNAGWGFVATSSNLFFGATVGAANITLSGSLIDFGQLILGAVLLHRQGSGIIMLNGRYGGVASIAAGANSPLDTTTRFGTHFRGDVTSSMANVDFLYAAGYRFPPGSISTHLHLDVQQARMETLFVP